MCRYNIRGTFLVLLNCKQYLILLPAIPVMATPFTSNARNNAVIRTLEGHWSVKIIDIMVAPCTIIACIRKWAISTLEMVNTIFFTISVLTSPNRQRGTFQKDQSYILVTWCSPQIAFFF